MDHVTAPPRLCPFCRVSIPTEARKCRHCGEYVDPVLRRAVEDALYGGNGHGAEAEFEPEFGGQARSQVSGRSPGRASSQAASSHAAFSSGVDPADSEFSHPIDDNIFWLQPSIASIPFTMLSGGAGFVVGLLLYTFPSGRFNLGEFLLPAIGSQGLAALESNHATVGASMAVAGLLFVVARAVILKSTTYRITSDRIELERGIFQRNVDNLDLFRIQDLRLHRNIYDLLLGIGTIVLTTSDKSHPEFFLRKIPYPRDVYDALKHESLEADRRQGVVHFEQ